MQLPFLKNKKEQRDFFLAVLLKPHKVGCILFEEINKNLTILADHEEKEGVDLENITPEELTNQLDKVISAVEPSLPEGASVNKTIFAVPYAWVEEGKIKKDYLLKLKKVCDDLALTPLGFIVSSEAIVAYLQRKQGAPITSIFIELSSKEFSIYMVRAGSIVEVKSASIGEHIIKDVEAQLKEVQKFDVLPAKIILFNSIEGEKNQQDFLSHHWGKSLPFLHVPQVTVLEKGFENEAIINGVASQMGFDTSPEPSEPHEKNEEDVPPPTHIIALHHEFGFVKEGEVDDEKLEKHDDEEKKEEEKDIIKDEPKIRIHSEPQHHREAEEEAVEEKQVAQRSTSVVHARVNVLSYVSMLTSKVKTLILPKISTVSGSKGLLLLPIILIFLLIGFSYVYYNFILRADIVILANKETFNKDASIELSSKDPTSASEFLLHMDIVEQEVQGEVDRATEGKKDTGEKAKGEVTIYNKTEGKKTFSKGTILVGTNKLEFKLVDDVSVSSTSAFSTSFSNVKAKVEADKFGQEYNLPSGVNLSFKDFASTSYFAKNDSAFSGGTKKTIQIVSKKDLDALSNSIIDSVTENAVKEVAIKIGGEHILIPTPLDFEFSEKNFSHELDEEANNVKLSATLLFKLGSFVKSEAEGLADELAHSEVPSGYSLDKESATIEVKDIKIDKNDVVKGVLHIESTYLPTIDSQKIIADAKGKSPSQVQTTIKEISGVSDVQVSFKNQLPLFPARLPSNPKNITVDIKT